MINVALLKNCVLVRLKTASFGNTRKVEVTRSIAEKTLGERPGDITDEDWEKKIGEALTRLRANKKLIVCNELEAIESFLSKFRSSLLQRYCNPSFIDDGLYAVLNVSRDESQPSPLLRMIEDIKAARERLENELIPAFKAIYPAKVDEARKLWNGNFQEKHYPKVEDIGKYFAIRYRVVQLDVPEGLPPEIRAEEEKKLRDEFEKARVQIVEALWTEFQTLVNHVVDRLTPGADGKRKVFQEGTIENIRGFIEAFGNRNAFNDARLANAVERAKQILDNLGGKGGESVAQRLRDFEAVRNKTAEAFGALKTEVDKGITELPGRSFQFDEE